MLSAQADVEQLLADQVSFPFIEDYIASRLDIGEDDRSALWLYAWAKSRTPTSDPTVAEASPRLWSRHS